SKSPTKGHPAQGAGGGSSGPTGTGASGGPTGTAGSLGTGAGGGPVISVPDASFVDAPAVDATCAGSVVEAHLIPLDLFIMLDQSTSMSSPVGTGTETRWSSVTKAIGSFVKQPEANGIGVGINYFGVSLGKRTCQATEITCMKDSDCAAGCGPCVQFMPGSP